jgi:hypothetical protein
MSRRSASTLWTSTCLGVDLQGDRRAVVLAERSRGRVNFSAVLPSDRGLSGVKGKGIPVVACLTVRESLTRWLEAPFASAAKAERVLPTLLDIQLPFPLEDCVHEFLPGRHLTGKTRALAVAARREEVAKKLAALAAAGLDPVVLDHEGLALWTESLRQAPPGRGEETWLRVVANLHGEQSSLVVGRGEEFLGAHGIRLGDVAHVRRILRLYQSADALRPPVKWMWAGPDAGESAFPADLTREWTGSSMVLAEPDTFLVRAIATRALTPGPLRCNLRMGALVHPDLAAREKRRAGMAAAVYLAAGLVLCAFNVGVRSWAKVKESRVDQTFSALADELAGYHVEAKGSDSVRVVSEKADKKIEAMRPFLDLFEPPLAATLAAVTESAKKHSLHVEAVSMDRRRVTVSGMARNWNGCDDLVATLRREGYPVKLDRKDAGPDGLVPFSVSSGGSP